MPAALDQNSPGGGDSALVWSRLRWTDEYDELSPNVEMQVDTVAAREEPIILDEEVDLDAEVVIVDGKRLTNADADAIAERMAKRRQ